MKSEGICKVVQGDDGRYWATENTLLNAVCRCTSPHWAERIAALLNADEARVTAEGERGRADGLRAAAAICRAEAQRWGVHAEADAARQCAEAIEAAIKEGEK